MRPFVFCHVPHSSTLIPENCRREFLTALPPEIGKMTDLYTDDLFDIGAERLIFPVSRLVCDPERFRDDEREPMSRVGMGAVYTRCQDGSPLRLITAVRREELLREWYDPHHRRLLLMTRRRLALFGRCLIIDGHSFPHEPLPYEEDKSPRPDICVGTDSFHTPGALAESLESGFRRLGYTVCRDRPFAGAIVPLPLYRQERRVASVMIEVDRSLYMDKAGGKTSRYQRTKNDLRRVLEDAAGELAP